MSIIKETIRFNNQDTNLKISLSIGNRLSGYQQEIDNLTEETKEELINPAIDNEVRRFTCLTTRFINFWFKNLGRGGGDPFNTSFGTDGAGFSSTEIEDKDDVLLNSFFIMDFYDTFDNNTQTKIFTTYLTQILDGQSSGGVPIPEYTIRSDTGTQWYHQYVPKSFLDIQNVYVITGYTKFSFYNAKYGTLSLFYNDANSALLTPEKMYVKTYFYLSSMQWDFVSSPNLYELAPDNSYVTKVNETFENFDNLKQIYPIGAFDPIDGKYEGGIGRPSRSSTRTVGTGTGGRTVGDRTVSTSTPRTR